MEIWKRSGARWRTSSTTRAPAMPLPITTSFFCAAWIIVTPPRVRARSSPGLEFAQFLVLDQGLHFPGFRAAEDDRQRVPGVAGQALDQPHQLALAIRQDGQGPFARIHAVHHGASFPV